jgi:glycosyltransferase involved in cell wall biosynthesis
VSGAEQRLLAEELPAARVEVVSNIHEVRGRGLPFAERQDLLFVGSYRHPPNVDAALWLAEEIFPRIRERLPSLRLHLVGGDAPGDVAALGARPGITFHGYVPDLDPLLEGCRVALAPLRYGAGVKGKVNQALSHGLPVVATTCAVEGMFLSDGVDVLVADEAEGFADAVARLHEDAALWETLSLGGQENTRRHFSSEAVRETLRGLLGGLASR